MNTMANPVPRSVPLGQQRPWYREPYVWLVIGGPLVVVLASIVTVYLAMSHVDPVLDRKADPVRLDATSLQQMDPKARQAAELSVMPAGQARNHVVTPTLPKD